MASHITDLRKVISIYNESEADTEFSERGVGGLL